MAEWRPACNWKCVRPAIPRSSFSLKNNPTYSAHTDLATVNFRHKGFYSCFVTLNQGFGEPNAGGIQGKIGGGLYLSNDAFEENQLFGGTIQSDATGNCTGFQYMTRFS
ncbi:MAG: hypothetical protein R3B47_00865 [Bacteroidia bacterium]